MSQLNKDNGRKKAKQVTGLSAKLLQGIKSVADQSGADTSFLADKLSEIEATGSRIDKHEPPKKLDWIVFAGFGIFMISLIIAIFSENIRWLGIAFMIMPIVAGFGLANNVLNMQPDWDRLEEDGESEIQVSGAPQSLKSASGSSSNKPQTKWEYWRVIILFSLAGLLFFCLGVFLTFSEFAGDTF